MHRWAAELVAKDVRQLLGEHLVAGLRQRAKRDLVRHRGRREEDRLLVAEEFRRALLERDHGRILALLFVADLGVGDRPPHPGRGLGQRVGAEVDQVSTVAKRKTCRHPSRAARSSRGSGRPRSRR